MANETKSSPADHYFEPNGSNANAENIGHVLNDLTDIVASGTPEEGIDAVKWDGENFILGPAGGGGDIDAEHYQVLIGDGEGNAIGSEPSETSKLFAKDGQLFIHNNELNDSSTTPFVIKNTYEEEVTNEDDETEIVTREHYSFSLNGDAFGVLGETAGLILHDNAQFHMTKGVNRGKSNGEIESASDLGGPKFWMHGNGIVKIEDEYFRTTEDVETNPYLYVEEIFTIAISPDGPTADELYKEIEAEIKRIVLTEGKLDYEKYDMAKNLLINDYKATAQYNTTFYLWSYLGNNKWNTVRYLSPSLSTMKSQGFGNGNGYRFNKGSAPCGKNYSSSTVLKVSLYMNWLADINRNISSPYRWSNSMDSGGVDYPVFFLRHRPYVDIYGDADLILGEHAGIYMNDQSKLNMTHNSQINAHGGILNLTAGIMNMEGGTFGCMGGNLFVHGAADVKFNSGIINFNAPEGNYRTEFNVNGDCRFLLGGISKMDLSYGQRSPDNFCVFEVNGHSIVRATGGSQINMMQNSELVMSQKSEIHMQDYGHVNLSGASKLMMVDTSMVGASPAIQMTPEQMRFGRFGEGQSGSTITTDYLYNIYIKPVEMIAKLEGILSKNEITEEEYEYLSHNLLPAIVSKYNFKQTVSMFDSKVSNVIRFTTAEALEQFQGWLTKYQSTSTQYYKTGYFKPAYIAKDASVSTIIEQSGGNNFCFLANDIPSSVSALGDDFIQQNYDLIYCVADASYITKFFKKSSEYGTSYPYQNYYQYCSKDLQMSTNPQVQTNYDNNITFTNRYIPSDITSTPIKKIAFDYYNSKNYFIKTSTGIPYAYATTAPATYTYDGTSLPKLYSKNDTTYTRLFSTSFNAVIDNFYTNRAKAPFVSIANNSHIIIENTDNSATFAKIGGSGNGRIETYVGSKDCNIFTQITGKTHVELHDDACIIMRGNTDLNPWMEGVTEGHMGRSWTRPILPNNNGPMCAMYDNSMVFMSREWENKTPKGKYTIIGVGLYPDIEKIDNNATVKFSVIKPIVLDWAEDKYEILNNDDDIITVGVDSGSTEEDRRLSNCLGIKFIPIGWKDSPDRQAGAPYFRMIGDVEISAKNGDFTFAYHNKSVTFSIDELERLKELLNN